MHVALRRSSVDLISCELPWCHCSLKDDAISRGLVLEVSSKSGSPKFFGDEEFEEPRNPVVAPLVLRTSSTVSQNSGPEALSPKNFELWSEGNIGFDEGDCNDDVDSETLQELPHQEVQILDNGAEVRPPPKRRSSFSDRFMKWSRRRTEARPSLGLQQRQGGAPVVGAIATELGEASAAGSNPCSPKSSSNRESTRSEEQHRSGHPLQSASPASSSTALTSAMSHRSSIFSNFRRRKGWTIAQIDILESSGGTQLEAISVVDGEGRFTYPSGDEYEGQFSRGQRHGEGTFWHKGLRPSTYHGQWIKDVRQGLGRTEWMRSGAIHEGAYAQDRMSGPGKMTLTSGACYDGEFLKDLFHGEGSIQNSDSSWYKGQWCTGQHHGFGNQSLADGTEYSGRFVEGLPHGNGSLARPSGTLYVGQFASGREHGNGTLKDPGGRTRLGLWNEGKFVRWLSGTTLLSL